jgi:hypothetical protein
MLLYLVIHSRFDIANSVRELSKVADRATIEYWKLWLRCIKYFRTIEDLALKLKCNSAFFFWDKAEIPISLLVFAAS